MASKLMKNEHERNSIFNYTSANKNFDSVNFKMSNFVFTICEIFKAVEERIV